MANQKHGMRMATATKTDIKNLHMLYNVLENVVKHDAKTIADFDHFEEEEKQQIKRIFNEDNEIDYEELATYLHGLTWGFHRVVMDFQVVYDNACDKTLDYLDFKPEIQEAFGALATAAKHLQTESIPPGSVLASIIIAASKKVNDDDDEETETQTTETEAANA